MLKTEKKDNQQENIRRISCRKYRILKPLALNSVGAGSQIYKWQATCFVGLHITKIRKWFLIIHLGIIIFISLLEIHYCEINTNFQMRNWEDNNNKSRRLISRYIRLIERLVNPCCHICLILTEPASHLYAKAELTFVTVSRRELAWWTVWTRLQRSKPRSG